jgi:two-component system LytT family response regulator
MKSLRVLIVDDEPLGRERVRGFVAKEEGLVLCGECANGREAVATIRAERPDLVFLDIRMPDLDGFGVLAELRSKGLPLPVIVFVTAYDEHALKAFEVNAIDYLLKPVQRARFEESVARARALLDRGDASALAENLARLLAERAPRFLRSIEAKSPGRIDYVPVDEILWIEADGNYADIHTASPKSHLARTTITELEQQLDPAHFLRIGRSVIVNLRAARTLRTSGRSHSIELAGGQKIAVTRNLDQLQSRLQFS